MTLSHTRNSTWPTLYLAVALLLAAAVAQADEPAKAQGSPATPAPIEAGPAIPDLPENQAEIEALKAAQPAGQAPTGIPAEPANALPRPETPRMKVLSAVLAAQQAQLAVLQDRLSTAPDATAALEIQREIERVKQQTEIDLLTAQARLAREAGQEQQAVAIEAAIGEMTSPRPVGVPQDRPAPTENR
jgi:hypothetical protein